MAATAAAGGSTARIAVMNDGRSARMKLSGPAALPPKGNSVFSSGLRYARSANRWQCLPVYEGLSSHLPRDSAAFFERNRTSRACAFPRDVKLFFLLSGQWGIADTVAVSSYIPIFEQKEGKMP